MLGGRLGWNIHDMNRADGLIISGNQHEGGGNAFGLVDWVDFELHGIGLRSPSRHPDILGGDDLLIKVEEMREATGYRLCVKTGLGEPDDDGRRRPVAIEGSEHEILCGAVIAAVGQRGICEELDRAEMMGPDRVRTEWDSMRTSDPKVFAAGDGAFGGSTIVMAMQHGQRAAYYVRHYLEGILKANAGEASMMARCAGKTRLHNIEPEDLRSVTRATAAATGIPLAGTRAA